MASSIISAVGDALTGVADLFTGDKKKQAERDRNDQKAQAAAAQQELKDQQLASDNELTQKRNRAKAMSNSRLQGGAGREGTILGSTQTNSSATAGYQTKTLLGQ